MAKKKWVKVSDDLVRHVWVPPQEHAAGCCADCPADPIAIPPTEYENSGIPICQECGADYVYSHTEVVRAEVTVEVLGGVAYEPARCPKHVKVNIRDRDNKEG